MKISEAKQLYSTQIRAYQEQQTILSKQKKELEEKMNSVSDGKSLFVEEAATLELTLNAVLEKKKEYQDYMNDLNQQWSAISTMAFSKQQQESTKDYVEDLGKIMEVARRLMKGDIVPPNDEKKLMEYSMEMYQAAKNMGALAKQKEREEHESLWDEEEEKKVYDDPMEVADNAQAVGGAPQIVDVADTMASAGITE